MEPSGRNWWQPVANGRAPKWLKQAKTVATGCGPLPLNPMVRRGRRFESVRGLTQKPCK
jgi:hypothetical protein